MVELASDVARELEVLELILADGNQLRAIQQDVRGLEHRIVEQPDVDVLGLVLALVLELRHPRQLAEPGHRVEHPAELGVLGHHRLHEHDRALRIDAEREQLDHHLEDASRHRLRVVRVRRDRVVIDDAVHLAVFRVLVLQRHPVANCTQVIAQMKLTGGLDPREHRFHRGFVYL
jgi:hypothetical protein